MTDTFIQLSEDEFDRQYKLVTNHLNANASWVHGEGPGCLFETYGPELEFVRQQDPSTIWTLVDGDCGDLCLISGYHFVNRIGYMISIAPVPDDVTIEVHLPRDRDDGEDDEEDGHD